MNHISLNKKKDRPGCYAKSPIVQNMFWSISIFECTQLQSRRTFFRHAMLDTVQNRRCVSVCCDLYTVTAYAVMSLIQTQPMWRQPFEGEDPETLSLFSTVCCSGGSFQSPLFADPPKCDFGWQKWAATVVLVLMLWSSVRSSSHVAHSPSL